MGLASMTRHHHQLAVSQQFKSQRNVIYSEARSSRSKRMIKNSSHLSFGSDTAVWRLGQFGRLFWNSDRVRVNLVSRNQIHIFSFSILLLIQLHDECILSTTSYSEHHQFLRGCFHQRRASKKGGLLRTAWANVRWLHEALCHPLLHHLCGGCFCQGSNLIGFGQFGYVYPYKTYMIK